MRSILLAFLVLSTIGVSGCRHKPVTPMLPPPAPAPLVSSAPVTATVPLVQTPEEKAPEAEVALPTHARAKKKKRPVVIATAAPPPANDVAAAPDAATSASASAAASASAIGELSTGTESARETRQEAKDLIVEVQKRVDSLSSQVSIEMKGSVSKIRVFLAQAEDALRSGDAAGARTLATKAKVLMDDLQEPG